MAERASATRTHLAAVAGIRSEVSLAAGAETEIAAMADTPPAKTGAATATNPGSSSSSVTAKPLKRTVASSASRAALVVIVRAVLASNGSHGMAAPPNASQILPSAEHWHVA